MVKRKYINTRVLRPGMIIDQSLIDKTGRILIARKTPLESFHIEALRKMNIAGVYIREGEEEPEEVHIEITAQAAEVIEKNRIEDRAKVNLSESVKKRVSEGIQYLYSNTASDSFTSDANNIANDLMKAITENDALALDVGTLKVSDEYTFKHSVDVATISMIIAKKSNLSEADVSKIGVAGLLHDIGKSQIPNEILNKAGRLTDEEFALMKKHSLFGYNILKEKDDSTPEILLGVLQHHEKLNGHGYPFGLTKPQISPYAKIISIADIYDALVTERPYKKAFSQRDAIEMIMAMTGDLDLDAMKSFLNSVILYPVDSVVKLSSGELAKVVENSSSYPLRPTVVGLRSGKLYNLSSDINCAHLIIE